MTINVANTTLTNTFEYLVNRTNELSNALTTKVVTADSNTTSGNAAITGTFSANVYIVGNSASNTSISAPNTEQKSSGEYFLNANGSWSRASILANSGIIANSSGVFVNANTGVVVNTAGVFVDSVYIGTLTSNNATRLGGTLAASYVQNTDSRTLSGNVTFSGANVRFTGANVKFTGASLSDVTVVSGTWGGTPIALDKGGTGQTTQSGARTALGLGTIATQSASNVTVTGGTINGITELTVSDGVTNTLKSNTTSTTIAFGSNNALRANSTSTLIAFGGDTALITNSTSTVIAFGGDTALKANTTSTVIGAAGASTLTVNSTTVDIIGSVNISGAVRVGVSDTQVINSTAGLTNISALDATTINTIENSISTGSMVTFDRFTSPGTYSKPVGLLGVKVIVGAGGGGSCQFTSGPNDNETTSFNSGGNGGIGIKYIPAASMAATVSVTVGGGGAAGGAPVGGDNPVGPAGGAGGASSFGTFVTTTGGRGGTPSADGAIGVGANANFYAKGGSGGLLDHFNTSPGLGNDYGYGAPASARVAGEPGIVIVEEYF
jgi:hypothetical protein